MAANAPSPVNPPAAFESAGTTEQRRQMLRIDAAYREWARNRSDVDRLRRLHEAIAACLGGSADTVKR